MSAATIEATHTTSRVRPAYAVLARKPGANGFVGLVEHSFAMDWNPERVCVWWSGKAYSILGEHQLDGKEDADDQVTYYSKRYPDWEIFAVDLNDPACPIEIDREAWEKAMQSGSKFDARNAAFWMKESA